MTALLEAAGACFGFIFIAAALAKIDDAKNWSLSLSSFFPLGSRLHRMTRRTVPAVEAGVGALTWFWLPVGSQVAGGCAL